MQAIDEDQDLKWLARIWVGDLMGIYLVMGGTMVQEHDGTLSDPCKPMRSKESVIQN